MSAAKSYFNLGLTYYSLKQYPFSQEFFEKALNIYKKVYGEQYPDVESTSNILRLVEKKQRELNECCIL